MKIEEAYRFYKKQFELSRETIDSPTVDTNLAEEIIEQVGKQFTSVLELGSGNGLLARSLSTFEKDITTVEIVPEMVDFADKFQVPNITSLCGSFYDIDITETFDAVLYIDGFGVGTDSEQLLLLKRIYNWLKDDGIGLIDIYQPNYWRKTNGVTMSFPNSNICRTYDYDQTLNRMIDTWWDSSLPEEMYTQSLACYSPDQINELCKSAGLVIIALFPGGAMDYGEWRYHKVVGLSECLSYRIKVMKK